MSANERRISPRKSCSIPIRFRVLPNALHRMTAAEAAGSAKVALRVQPTTGILEGETVNLSERGVYFRSREDVQIGTPLEMYLTIPRELTGRRTEEVRCSARVVHVEPETDRMGRRGVGACVERFEPIASARNWSN